MPLVVNLLTPHTADAMPSDTGGDLMPERETRTVYVTKYALTRGIFPEKVERVFPENENAGWQPREYVYTRTGSNLLGSQYCLGVDAFLTTEEALAAAEVLRTKKLSSLKKQIA